MAKYIDYQPPFEGSWQPRWEWEKENADQMGDHSDEQPYDDEEQNIDRTPQTKVEWQRYLKTNGRWLSEKRKKKIRLLIEKGSK